MKLENLDNVKFVSAIGAGSNTLELIDTAKAPASFLEEWPESGEFYRTSQHTIPGFTFGYLVGYRGGIRVAVIPYFIMDFKINTMLDKGLLKSLLGWLSLRIACIGHPTTPFGRIDGEVSEELLCRAYTTLSAKVPVVAFKGFGDDLLAHGFVRVAGLPVAAMRFDEDAWNIRRKKRNFTRKLKASAALRFEEHEGLPSEYLEQVYQLYLNTLNESPIHFERLSPEYFSNTSELSIYILVFLQDRLVGFVQLISKGDKVAGKYLGMDYTVSREHELYFALCLRIVDMSTRRGFKEIEFGETLSIQEKTGLRSDRYLGVLPSPQPYCSCDAHPFCFSSETVRERIVLIEILGTDFRISGRANGLVL